MARPNFSFARKAPPPPRNAHDGVVLAPISAGQERYDIIEQIAHGSTADLLLAVRRGALGVDSLVVIKRLRTGPGEDPRAIQGFLQEARVSVRLRHANIVQTFAVGEDHGVPYMAMEYLEGESLRDVLAACAEVDARLPVALSVYVACEVLKGLHYAHTLLDYKGNPLGCVHRDVSPHNLFLGYDGSVKVIDFGIAKTTLAAQKTADGVVKGKLSYLSPEQALGQPVDLRSDLFSLGITLWEMLTMRRLMVGGSPFDVMSRIIHEPSPLAGDVVEGVPPGIDRVLARALDRDPARRFESAEAMRLALKEAAQRAGLLASVDDVAESMATLFGAMREKKRAWLADHMMRFEMGGSASGVDLERSMARAPWPGTQSSLQFLGPSSHGDEGLATTGTLPRNQAPDTSSVAPRLRMDSTRAKVRLGDWLKEEFPSESETEAEAEYTGEIPGLPSEERYRGVFRILDLVVLGFLVATCIQPPWREALFDARSWMQLQERALALMAAWIHG